MDKIILKDKLLAFNMYFNFCYTFYNSYINLANKCYQAGIKLDGTDDIVSIVSINSDNAMLLHSLTQFQMLFYASLNTLVEGYREIKVKDNDIEEHLIPVNVATLKKFRHTVFHYQEYLKDKRFTAFVVDPNLKEWGLTLYDLFKNWITHQIAQFM